MANGKTIALVEWVWHGHHPMYFKFFTRALLELGCTVIGFCPDPADVTESLKDVSPDSLSRLTLYQFKWKSPARFAPRRFKYRLAALHSVRSLAKQISESESRLGKTIDLTFFACMYDSHFSRFPEADLAFPYPWSGLYLPSGKFRKLSAPASWSQLPAYVKTQLSSNRMKSLAIWDEGLSEMLSSLCQRPVICVPDLTYETIDEQSVMIQKLKRFADGAPIIGILGFLKRSKGVVTLARLAMDPAYRDLCFAFIGEVEWSGFNSEEKALIAGLMDKCPNAYTHFASIDDDRTFNSCVTACDIVFAAYLDFAQSSGILTKAAVFEKPVLVSEGFLMAERVRRFKIGAIVPEGDLGTLGRAIRNLLNGEMELPAGKPDWSGFRETHSFNSLKSAMSEILKYA